MDSENPTVMQSGRISMKAPERMPEDAMKTDRFEQEVTVQLEEEEHPPQPLEDTMQAIIREDKETKERLFRDLLPWLLGYLAHCGTLLAAFLVLARAPPANNRDTILRLGLTYYTVFFCYQLLAIWVPPRSKAKTTRAGLELLEAASKLLGLILIETRLVYICFVGCFFLGVLLTVLHCLELKKSYEDLVKYQIVVCIKAGGHGSILAVAATSGGNLREG